MGYLYYRLTITSLYSLEFSINQYNFHCIIAVKTIKVIPNYYDYCWE